MNIATSHNLILILLISMINTNSFAVSSKVLQKEDDSRAAEQLEECEEVKAYGVRDDYPVDCFSHYHHFGGDALYNPSRSGSVTIASFNAFHPGSDSSLFKDMELVARLMDRYDLVAAQELLPVVSRHKRHNVRLIKFIDEKELKLNNLRSLLGSRKSNVAIENLQEQIEKAYSFYRMPGYLLILRELRKLDDSWSLILAPGADAEKSRSVKELVGFYYRASSVRPIDNEHCGAFANMRGEDPIACFPDFSKKWLGTDIRSVFSRRPFVGSFESGSFDFTLITSHVVFGGPTLKQDIADILRPSFGVEHYDELGRGVNKQTYARFAEVKSTLDIAQQMKKDSKEKDIIFLGDFNLETTNDFWSEVLPSFKGSQIYVDEQTTLSAKYQLSNGTLTNGLASSFDHVIMDPNETDECSENVATDDFVNDDFSEVIDGRYLIRSRSGFRAKRGGRTLQKNMEEAYLSHLESLMTVKRSKLVLAMDQDDIENFLGQFSRRLFDEQLEKDTYYKVYREVISDHLPVYMSCSI